MDERDQAPHYPPLEVIQPDPMLKDYRGTIGNAAVFLGAAAIIVLVLYGLTRPEGPQQEIASAPSPATQTAPAGPPAQPSTTGQGQNGDQQAKPEKSEDKPARSDSANETGSKSQPQQQPAQ